MLRPSTTAVVVHGVDVVDSKAMIPDISLDMHQDKFVACARRILCKAVMTMYSPLFLLSSD
jgi:hypothetical protein